MSEGPWGPSPFHGILEYWCDTLLYLLHCIDTIKEEIKLYYQKKKVLPADFQTQKYLHPRKMTKNIFYLLNSDSFWYFLGTFFHFLSTVTLQ